MTSDKQRCRQLFAIDYSPDIRPQSADALIYPLVSPINVLDAGYFRRAISGESGDDMGHAGPNIAHCYGRAVEPPRAMDEGGVVILLTAESAGKSAEASWDEGNTRAHPPQVLDIAEAVIIDRFMDDRFSWRLCQEYSEWLLPIGHESWM